MSILALRLFDVSIFFLVQRARHSEPHPNSLAKAQRHLPMHCNVLTPAWKGHANAHGSLLSEARARLWGRRRIEVCKGVRNLLNVTETTPLRKCEFWHKNHWQVLSFRMGHLHLYTPRKASKHYIGERKFIPKFIKEKSGTSSAVSFVRGKQFYRT